MNLLYIFSDQHSRAMMGAYGNPYVHTPNLDRLTARGVRFDNAYCNSPLCVPSRTSMVLGDYAFKSRCWENAHPYIGKEKSWGHRLEENGVRVTTMGKLHYKDERPETGFYDQRIPLHVKDGTGDVTQCVNDETFKRPKLGQAVLDAKAGTSSYIDFDEKISELAIKYLEEETKTEKPWCLYLGYVTPHYPLTVPDEYLDLYKPFDKLPLPVDWDEPNRPHHEVIDYFRNTCCFDKINDINDVRRAVACYYALCTFLDAQIGKVLDKLDELGMTEDTMIIYSTDHGEMMGKHGLYFKKVFYEDAAAVPLVVAGPGIPEGETVKIGASLVDIYPTLLDNFNIQPDEHDKSLPGTSLFKIIDGSFTEDRPIFSETHCGTFGTSLFMVRHGRYKLNYYVNHKPQLFDLVLDIHERNDLAENPKYASVLAKMEETLRTQFCDPEEIYKQAKADQAIVVEAQGGIDALRSRTLAYSPAPKV